MKKNWLKGLFGILYIFSFTFGLTVPTYAEETSSTAAAESPIGFSYKVIQPENQRDTSVGYFDLRMTPGQVQTVQIELANSSNVEKTVEIDLNRAKTNGNGVIEYGPIAIDKDASMKYDFEEIVTGPESVTIPAQSIATVDLTITMPESSYDGIIVGGIQLKEAVDEEARAKQTGVINEYAFMIGMRLSETDTEVLPELALNSVYAGLMNYRNSIFVNFSNVEAAFLSDLTVEVQINKQGSEAVLYDTKKAGMQVAPNSLVDFPVSMNGEKMEPGDYHAHILATAGDRKWEWDQDFTITDEEADKFNKQDVSLTQEEGINWVLVGIIAGAGLVLGLVIFFVVRLVRKNKQKKQPVRKKKTSTKKNRK